MWRNNFGQEVAVQRKCTRLPPRPTFENISFGSKNLNQNFIWALSNFCIIKLCDIILMRNSGLFFFHKTHAPPVRSWYGVLSFGGGSRLVQVLQHLTWWHKHPEASRRGKGWWHRSTYSVCVCGGVCVCVWERESEKGSVLSFRSRQTLVACHSPQSWNQAVVMSFVSQTMGTCWSSQKSDQCHTRHSTSCSFDWWLTLQASCLPLTN